MKKRTFDIVAQQKIKRLAESALSILPFTGSIYTILCSRHHGTFHAKCPSAQLREIMIATEKWRALNVHPLEGTKTLFVGTAARA